MKTSRTIALNHGMTIENTKNSWTILIDFDVPKISHRQFTSQINAEFHYTKGIFGETTKC